MTHHEQSPSSKDEKMYTLTAFEHKIALSSPQPREDFQAELAARLGTEIANRNPTEYAAVSQHPRRFGRMSARTVVILAALLTVGIGVVIAMSTVYQRFIQYDMGLKAIFDQGLGHEIGISQTIEDFTVKLEWAYADGNRLTLAYLIAGKTGEQYSNLTSDVYTLTMRDTGEKIPLIQGMGVLVDHNGEPVGWGAPADVIPVSDRTINIHTYDLGALDYGDSTTLDLRLEVDVYGITLQQRTRLPIEAYNEMKEGPEEHFIFDFSVALVDNERVLAAPITATDQDITLTLQRVSVSPSQTRVVVCFAPPDPARKWTSIPALTTDDGEVPGGGGVNPFMDREQTCDDFIYFAGMYDYMGDWRLEITELVGFGDGGGADQQRIPGSWVFEFVVP